MNLQELFEQSRKAAIKVGTLDTLEFRLSGVDETKFVFGYRDGHYIAVPINKEVDLPEKVGNLILVVDTDENISYYIDRRDLK
jgi:hypothetical protein